MGNNCCGQPAETTNNFNLKDGEAGKQTDQQAAVPVNHKPEAVNEQELEYKTDQPLGEGAVYTGQMKKVDGTYIKHGKGTQTWQDGAKYNGDWRSGMAEGEGVFYHANGDVYTGEFYQDRANGFGVYVHSNGQKYEGFWKNDMQDGPGKEELEDGSKYDGMFKDGKKWG